MTNKTFARKPPSEEPKTTMLILCEDSKSALVYLKKAKSNYGLSNITVKYEDTCPEKAVKFAIKNKRQYDKIYCCIDGGDEHARFDSALELATSEENIYIIASYPCFEFWLLLHFQKTRKGYAKGKIGSKAVIADLKKEAGMASYDKTSENTKGLFKQLQGKLDTAIINAKWAEQEAKKDDNKNPSTDLYILLEKFKSLELK
jgi:hypothetical protein